VFDCGSRSVWWARKCLKYIDFKSREEENSQGSNYCRHIMTNWFAADVRLCKYMFVRENHDS